MDYDKVIERLKEMGNPKNFEGMAHFGINSEKNLGVSVNSIRKFAKDIGKNHELALKLWKSGIRDARILAAHVDRPSLVTENQMENWVKNFNSWDVCDNTTGHLFVKTEYAYEKAIEWSKRD